MTSHGDFHTRIQAVSLDPDHPVRYRSVDSQSEWSTDNVRLRRLYGEVLLHRDHDLYVAERALGRDLQDLIRSRLRAERFGDDDAQEWAFRHWYKWLIPTGTSFNDEVDPWVCDQVV